jgi:alkanesulfonate monooxygenase SsuD/methylene tetrahydromethanopterin reductase-like flavin-dependent oxidoreductase (luciferase family)
MLKIGVRPSSRFEDAGEYLADARALDAAGVDSLWLDERGDDPWLLLAGIAAVTGHVRLVAPVSATDRRGPDQLLDSRVTTLDRLSRSRVVLKATMPPAAGDTEALIGRARRAGRCRLILEMSGGAGAGLAARLADGVMGLDESPEAWRSAFASIIRLREDGGLAEAFELWAPVRPPDSREHWRRMLREYEALGATGVLVRADPRLLDILRNPDEEDDRSDLALAQG